MSRQHLIPAALLGEFSSETTGRRRDRRLWVARRGQRGPHRARAGSVGFERDPYLLRDLERLRPDLLDRQWRGYEQSLPWAIDLAAAVPAEILYAEAWLILVQFVAGLLVRTPDYAEADATGLRELFGEDLPDGLTVDNANITRMMDYQWLSSTLLFCRWALVGCDDDLLTNDGGYCLAGHPSGWPALAVPLRPNLLLLISRGPGNLRAWWDGKSWRVEGIEHLKVDRGNPAIAQVNRTLALTARREIYGATEEGVATVARTWAANPDRVGPPPPPRFLYASPAKRQELEDRIFVARDRLLRPPDQRPPWLIRFDAEHAWTSD